MKFFCELRIRTCYVLLHLHHFQQFLPLFSLATLRILGELHQHRLRLPDPHDEIKAACLEAATEVRDGVDEEGGSVGASLVEVGCRLAVVRGVEAVDGEDREGVIIGGETLIVEEAEVVAEPDEGGAVEGGDIGRVVEAVGSKGRGGDWRRWWI